MRKYLIFALFVSIMFIPALSQANTATVTNYGNADYSSYSIDQLQALVNSLLKQIEELKKGLQCTVPSTNLSIGDGDNDNLNNDVKSLQEFLREKNYFTVKSTGYFGKYTRTALTNFQRDMGIVTSGELDNATREKIQTLTCKKATTAFQKAEVKIEPKIEVKVEKPVITDLPVIIKLYSPGENVINWIVKQGISKSGFKIVWSLNSGPTYPTRTGDSYIYLTDPNSNYATLSGFDGPGTYYVRVCEYINGACGVYSNEIALKLL